MKDIAKKYEKKHVIECHNVPDIDMNKQDGGLLHMAGVYISGTKKLQGRWRLYI